MAPGRVLGRVGIGVAVAMLMQFAGTMLFYAIAFVIFAEEFVLSGTFAIIAQFVGLYLIGVPVMLLILQKIPDSDTMAPPLGARYEPGEFLRLLVICYGGMTAINWGTLLLMNLVETLVGQVAINPIDTLTEFESPVLEYLYVIIAGPVMEEFVFRRTLYRKLARYGGRAYMLITAILFALFHTNVFQLFYAFWIGALLAYVYQSTGKFWYCAGLHIGINMLGYSVAGPLANGSEGMQMLGGLTLLVIAVTGIVLLIRWFLAGGMRTLRFVEAEEPLPRVRSAILRSFGMWVFFAVTAALTVYTLMISFGVWV